MALNTGFGTLNLALTGIQMKRIPNETNQWGWGKANFPPTPGKWNVGKVTRWSPELT